MRSKFGKAFQDEIAKVSLKSKHFQYKTDGSSWQESLMTGKGEDFQTKITSVWRKVTLAVLIIVFISLISFRLFHLQVVEGSYNRELADSNRIQIKIIHAQRGVIYDRNGKILSQNEPGFRLVEDAQNSKFKYLTRDAALKLEVEDNPLAAKLEIDSNRTYPNGRKTAHILGYVGEITAEELKDISFKKYQPGDKIGRGGVEQAYEKFLRGVDGGEVIEVDSTGKKIRTLRKTDAIPGQNLYLSIDVDLQQRAYNLLNETLKKQGVCCGAVAVQDPESGQILSLVSIPSFDPMNIPSSLIEANSPFLNRVISGTYPPGSTFKIASALAGLHTGKITKSTLIEDTGVISLGPYKFANWYFSQYGRTEGAVDLVKALKRSNDIYFYRVGELIGEKNLSEVSKILGLGKKTGIDIPGETEGVIPDNAWKIKNIGDVWYPGDSLHMAIGQGFVLTTPLQINQLVSTIAADGRQFPPHLALRITTPGGEEIKHFNYDSILQKFKKEDIQLIKKGLEEVTINGGTAWPFFTFPIKTAGKTGTAEFGDPKDRTHAWYTSYAPTDNPQIAITALVEAGGEGSSIAAPITKELYRWYFSPDKSNLLKDISPIVATESARTLGE